MTLFFYLGSSALFSAGTALASGNVRLGDINGLAQTANQGEAAFSNLTVDDPAGALTFVGLRPFWVEETAASPSRIWTGYVTSRTYQRDPDRSQIVGSDRTVVLTLVDINAILNLRVIAFHDGKRPQESDLARIAWLLGSTYMGTATGSQVHDNGQVALSTGITMDAADYRGQYPADVLNDCANASQRNYFIYWDSTAASGHELSLYYHHLGFTTGFASTIQLSNLSTAIDNSVTFAATGVLTRDPQDVYSSVWMPYDGGHVFHTRDSTRNAFIARQAVADASKTKSRTTAGKRAEAFLDAADTEADEIDAHVRLPKAKVNAIDIGRAVNVHFDHLPGYSSGYTSLQVVARQVNQVVENPDWYDVDLHLASPKPSGGAPGGGSGAPFEPDCDTDPISFAVTQSSGGGGFSAWGNDGGTTWLDTLVDGTAYTAAWTFTNGVPNDGSHLEYTQRIFFTQSDPTAAGFSATPVSWLPRAGDTGHGDDALAPGGTLGAGVVQTGSGTWTFSTATAAVNGWTAGDPLWFYAHGGWSPGTGNGGSATLVLTPVDGGDCATPTIGQTVPPETAGTGNDTTTTYTTNYPYQPGSLHVTVNGIAWVATETDPDAGTFTLPVAPPTGAVINVEYQAADDETTGAGNAAATPVTVPSFPYTSHVGDLMVSDGSNHWRTFSGGSNTQVLTRDMTQPLGVKWAAGGSGGLTGITSNGSNQVTGVANLVAGSGIALGVSGQDISIINTRSSTPSGGSATDAILGQSGVGGARISGLQGSPDIDVGGTNDDEFNGSLSGSWTQFTSPDSVDSNSTAKSHLYLKKNATASVAVTGVVKAIPSMPFTVTAKLSAATLGRNDYIRMGGLFVCASNSSSPGKMFAVHVNHNSAQTGRWQCAAAIYTSPTVFSSLDQVDDFDGIGRPPIWYRLVVTSSTNISAYFSADGYIWHLVIASKNPSFTVAGVGLLVDPEQANYAAEALYDWIRFT